MNALTKKKTKPELPLCTRCKKNRTFVSPWGTVSLLCHECFLKAIDRLNLEVDLARKP